MGENTDTTQILESRKEIIASRWYEAVAPIVPEQNAADLRTQLSESTEQAITLLLAKAFSREISHAIGGALARNVSADAQFLSRTQKTLAQQFAEGLPDEQATALLPRLADLLSELAVGFIQERDKLTQSMRRKFLSTTSHDMRSPLNAIIGFSRIIMKGVDGPTTDLQQQDLSAIYEGGKKLLDMINDVFSIEKIEAGGIDLEVKPLDIAVLVDSAVGDVESMASENGNTLLVNTTNAPAGMASDGGKVKQILVNLLSYATRFTREGTITLTVTADAVAGQDGVRFQIADTGLGMTSAQLQKFTQASQASTMEYGEIGLMISQRLCQLLGGDLTIESQVGKGTTFIAKLPAKILG